MEPVRPEDALREPLPTLDYAPPPEAIPTAAGCLLIAMGSVIGMMAGALCWVLLAVGLFEHSADSGAFISVLLLLAMVILGMVLGSIVVLNITRRKQ